MGFAVKIVYITNGMASTLNSSLELSRRLTDAGHEVIYLSQADVCPRVQAAGYRCRRLEADQAFQEEAPGPVSVRKPIGWARTLLQRRGIRRRSVRNTEIESAVAELDPDLLLIDIEMHFAIIATASLGIPTLLPIVWFSIFKHPALPPMHTKLTPPATPRGRLAIALAWWRLRIRVIGGDWKDRLRRTLSGDLFRPVAYDTVNIDDLRALAKSRTFSLRRNADRSHWLRPYAYTRLPVLSFTAREMEFPHEPWPMLHYVGPMVLRDRPETLVDEAASAAWRRFAADRRPGRPLVYCSLGTFWSMDDDFLRRVLDVFERRTDWDLVIGLGGKLDPARLAPIPPNALVVDYAPQLEVLAQADCAITHGGITTINECIEFEVPMVVYSTEHVDQDGCAARVAFHRLGVVADIGAAGVDAVEGNIERALQDAEIRENVAAMRAHFDGYRSPDAAVRLIESLGGPPTDT